MVRTAAPRSVPQQDLAEQISQDGMFQPLQRLTRDQMSAFVDVLAVDVPAAGTVLVSHRLQRKPVGWMVTDCYGAAAASLRRVPWTTASPYDETLYLRLYSDTATTVNLRVW